MNREPQETAPVETRKLAAIMFTDMVGFSRQMGANEARTLRLLTAHNQIVQQAVAEYSLWIAIQKTKETVHFVSRQVRS